MATFKIIGNEPITMPSPIGGFQAGRRITAQLEDGTQVVVKVPAEGNWADAANHLICAQVEQIAALHEHGA